MKTYRIFLLAGQSNMAGRGDARELPAHLQEPQLDVRYHYVCSLGADKGPPFSEGGGYTSEGWVELQPDRKHPSTPDRHFGPEITFGRTIADRWSEENIAIIKHGRGGSGLADDWDPDATSGKQLYRQFANQIESATQLLRDEGNEYRMAGMLWLQGESDSSVDRERAEAYQKNLEELIAMLRADVNEPELPFVIAQIKKGADIHPESGGPWMIFSNIVQEAQVRVAEADPFGAWVATDDLPERDPAHLNSEGMMKGRGTYGGGFSLHR